jgi:hypothetical protein
LDPLADGLDRRCLARGIWDNFLDRRRSGAFRLLSRAHLLRVVAKEARRGVRMTGLGLDRRLLQPDLGNRQMDACLLVRRERRDKA